MLLGNVNEATAIVLGLLITSSTLTYEYLLAHEININKIIIANI